MLQAQILDSMIRLKNASLRPQKLLLQFTPVDLKN